MKDVKQSEAIPDYPTFRIYKAGNKVDELVGASDKMLEDLIKKNTGYMIYWLLCFRFLYVILSEINNDFEFVNLKKFCLDRAGVLSRFGIAAKINQLYHPRGGLTMSVCSRTLL